MCHIFIKEKLKLAKRTCGFIEKVREIRESLHSIRNGSLIIKYFRFHRILKCLKDQARVLKNKEKTTPSALLYANKMLIKWTPLDKLAGSSSEIRAENKRKEKAYEAWITQCYGWWSPTSRPVRVRSNSSSASTLRVQTVHVRRFLEFSTDWTHNILKPIEVGQRQTWGSGSSWSPWSCFYLYSVNASSSS